MAFFSLLHKIMIYKQAEDTEIAREGQWVREKPSSQWHHSSAQHFPWQGLLRAANLTLGGTEFSTQDVDLGLN